MKRKDSKIENIVLDGETAVSKNDGAKLTDKLPAIIFALIVAANLSFILSSCKKEASSVVTAPESKTEAATGNQYIIEQAISDEAQRNTIAFDGLAFLTGTVGSQSFLPPGKVADYSGFQYLRDNDPTGLGHNTSFVTIIAYNILNILSTDQINLFIESARNQIDLINQFGTMRFPLLRHSAD